VTVVVLFSVTTRKSLVRLSSWTSAVVLRAGVQAAKHVHDLASRRSSPRGMAQQPAAA
jgi:hypothetical protein